MPGVNVIVAGSQEGTITDIDEDYSILVQVASTLKFSFIGYLDQYIVVGHQSVINAELTSDVTELGEVVVTAFGIEKDKKSLGYAVQKVDGEEIFLHRATLQTLLPYLLEMK